MRSSHLPSRELFTDSGEDGQADPPIIFAGVRVGGDRADDGYDSSDVVGLVVTVKFVEHWPAGTTTSDGASAVSVVSLMTRTTSTGSLNDTHLLPPGVEDRLTVAVTDRPPTTPFCATSLGSVMDPTGDVPFPVIGTTPPS
jgi:hypothetical protein